MVAGKKIVTRLDKERAKLNEMLRLGDATDDLISEQRARVAELEAKQSEPRPAKPKKMRFKLPGFQRDIALVAYPEGTLELREVGTQQKYTISVGGLFLHLVKVEVESGLAKRTRRSRSRSSSLHSRI